MNEFTREEANAILDMHRLGLAEFADCTITLCLWITGDLEAFR